MNANLIARALCFHGQPLQKIWEDENGAQLQQSSVLQSPDYSIYLERQKHFTFQDRAKRLKLHQFLARKSEDLYDTDLKGTGASIIDDGQTYEKSKPYVAILPPYEIFINKKMDKIKRWRSVLEGIKPGDLVYGTVTKPGSVHAQAIMIKALCTAEPVVRYLGDIPAKAYIHLGNAGPPPLDKHGNPRSYSMNEFVCCEVLEVSADAERLCLGMQGVLTKNTNIKLGIVSQDDLPEYYRKSYSESTTTAWKYDKVLRKCKAFLNPNYDVLFQINGIDVNDTFTLMSSLKYPFPRQEYGRELRQAQASKWAFRSVADGIEYFKIGQHVEAFQCLNKALNIDPCNVEGLVARGALYANKGSFLKAVDDFEKALKLNSYHVNARKYMGETLVALGRSYEDDNRVQDAIKAYKDCLNIIPNHEQARLSLEAIHQRAGGQYVDNLLNISGVPETEMQQKTPIVAVSDTSSEDSSGESNESSSESVHTVTNRNRGQYSLSPLSKRMVMHASSMDINDSSKQQFNQPFYMANCSRSTVPPLKDPNEFKLDEDDTETRVRKLLQEASKHKKEKTKKSKKKKSKKSKKSDSEAGIFDKINFEEAFKVISGINFENKLIDTDIDLYEKRILEIKKRQEILEQSTSASSRQMRERSETPPPKPPSMKIRQKEIPPYIKQPTSTFSFAGISSAGAGTSSVSAVSTTAATAAVKNTYQLQQQQQQQPKLSFQIKRAVKVDKFGLVRIATPLVQKSPTHSRSRSPRRTRSRSRDSRDRSRRYRSRRTRWDSRSRSRSNSSERRYRHRSSRRRSNSRSRSRRLPSRGRRAISRRRTPSPFMPRDTPPRRHRSRSRDSSRNRRNRKSRSPLKLDTNHKNRVWQRPGHEKTSKDKSNSSQQTSSNGRWLHDKFNEIDDGPSIEEIDEIINKAQKERKQEIISRDKNLLKKPNIGNF